MLIKLDTGASGEKYIEDDLTLNQTSVDCGFEPKYIFLTWHSTSSTSNNNNWGVAVYDSDNSTSELNYMLNKTQNDNTAMGTESSPIKSITNNGFTIGSTFAASMYMAHYWAIG